MTKIILLCYCYHYVGRVSGSIICGGVVCATFLFSLTSQFSPFCGCLTALFQYCHSHYRFPEVYSCPFFLSSHFSFVFFSTCGYCSCFAFKLEQKPKKFLSFYLILSFSSSFWYFLQVYIYCSFSPFQNLVLLSFFRRFYSFILAFFRDI